jgi:hypothetical protein
MLYGELHKLGTAVVERAEGCQPAAHDYNPGPMLFI